MSEGAGETAGVDRENLVLSANHDSPRGAL